VQEKSNDCLLCDKCAVANASGPRQTKYKLDKLSPEMMIPLLKLVRKLGVFALGFWLAGAGCLLGCEGMVTAAAGQDSNLSSNSDHASTIAEGNACSSGEGHGCCKKKSRAVRSTPAIPGAHGEALVRRNPLTAQNLTWVQLAESSTTSMNACPFAISRALAVAKIHDSQMATAVVSTELHSAIVREQESSLSTLSPMPIRGPTYLRCCAFLI
jgi:hypothetical protein